MTTSTRAVIYTRVSSDQQHRGRSVSEQEQECRAVCEREGWTVGLVLSDNDRSASRYATKDRPEYDRLSDVLQAGDVLVTWEASRAQRDLDAYLSLRNLCAERGVLWSYSGRTYDLSAGDDRFSTGLDALLSEKASEETRARVLRAKRADATAGAWSGGRAPLGYKLHYGDGSKKASLVLDSEVAPMIVDAAERALAGESLRSIHRDWAARGIGSFTRPAGLGRLLQRPLYAGLRVHRGEVVGTAAWPAIISEETHRRLVAKLSDPARRTTMNQAGRTPLHLLTGEIAQCGCCGENLRFSRARGRESYRCPAGHVHISEERLDAYVTDQLVLPVLSAFQFDMLFETDGDDGEMRSAAKAEALVLRTRLNDFTDAGARGELTVATLSRIEGELLPQIEALERKAQPAYRDPLLDANLHEAWADGGLEVQRRIIKLLFGLRIMPQGKGRRRAGVLIDPATVVEPRIPGIAEILTL